MGETLNENFAAIAVMGELYNSGKDVYDILAAYLQIVIQTAHLNNFTSADITEQINKTNSFHISESVVKTALKRLGLRREYGRYSLTDEFEISINEAELIEHTRQHRAIVEKLFQFVERETGQAISVDEKIVIEEQFYKYLEDPECEEKYTILISKFLMDNTLETNFYDAISRIKEGLLVYEGISFSPEVGQSGNWEFPLDVFLELEVLFFIAGYNGAVHKELYGQLIDYVSEINSLDSSKKDKLIHLHYTEDVKLEIEYFFSTAELIFEKNEIVDPSKKAMIFILEDVTAKSDIQIKKVQFYKLLTGKGITEFKTNFFAQENLQYNTLTKDTYTYNCEHIETDKGDEYIARCTDKINQINILRKNRNNSLKDARYVLLTSNGTILRCAYMPNAYHDGETPKAVNLDYLINRFWYKLNKGFGKGVAPKSIDIISRAQMVIASMIVSKVSQAYEDIKKKYADGTISDQEVAGILGELRKISKNPEDITSDQIDENIRFLSDYDISKRIEDIRREEIARERDKETIARLQAQLDDLQREKLLDNQKQRENQEKLEKRIASLEEKNSKSERDKQELERAIQSFINRENRLKLGCKKAIRSVVLFVCVCAICVIFFFICKFVFRFDKSVSGLISIVLTVLFQFWGPLKTIWRRYVMECTLKEKQ